MVFCSRYLDLLLKFHSLYNRCECVCMRARQTESTVNKQLKKARRAGVQRVYSSRAVLAPACPALPILVDSVHHAVQVPFAGRGAEPLLCVFLAESFDLLLFRESWERRRGRGVKYLLFCAWETNMGVGVSSTLCACWFAADADDVILAIGYGVLSWRLRAGTRCVSHS